MFESLLNAKKSTDIIAAEVSIRNDAIWDAQVRRLKVSRALLIMKLVR